MKVISDLGQYLFVGVKRFKDRDCCEMFNPLGPPSSFYVYENTLNSNLYNATTPYLKVKFYCQNFVSLQIRYNTTKEHTFAKEGMI